MSKTKLLRGRTPTILTVVAALGVVTTMVLTAKAVPKAEKRKAEAEEEKGEELTKLETAVAIAPAYIPTVLVGASTIACIFGIGVFSHKSQASLASAYALLDTSYKEYKGKLKELYGEEAHQKILEAIAVEKAEHMYLTAATFGTSCDLSLDENTSEPVWFFEENGNCLFQATIEQVIQAEYHFNRNYVLRGYANLGELYQFLGLPSDELKDTMWWTVCDELYWVDFNHRKKEIDGKMCYFIETPFSPRAGTEEDQIY
jgi:hypothetical protein